MRQTELTAAAAATVPVRAGNRLGARANSTRVVMRSMVSRGMSSRSFEVDEVAPKPAPASTPTSIVVPGQRDPEIVRAIELSTDIVKGAKTAKAFITAVRTIEHIVERNAGMTPSDYKELNTAQVLIPMFKAKKGELGDAYDNSCSKATTRLFRVSWARTRARAKLRVHLPPTRTPALL